MGACKIIVYSSFLCSFKNVLSGLLVFLYLFSGQSQSNGRLSKTKLYQLSFESLIALEDSLDLIENKDYLRDVLDIHIAKAKLSKDTLELINTYRWRVWQEELSIGLKYADSAIFLGLHVRNMKYPCKAYYSKGVLLYENNYPTQALDEFIFGYKHAKEVGNYEVIIDCINSIASLKREFGQEDEALVLQRKSLRLLSKYQNEVDNYDITYLFTLANISRSYVQTKQFDSAKIYVKKGLWKALEIDNFNVFRKLSVLQAQMNYYDDNYIKSRDTLIQYVGFFDGESKADILFYLGMIEGKLANENKKWDYLVAFDSILESINLPLIDNTKETYAYLLQSSIEKGDDILERKYISRLIYYDSLQQEVEKKLKKTTLEKFDMLLQKEEREAFKNQVKYQSKMKTMFYLLSIVSLIISMILYLRYRNTKKRLKQVMLTDIKPYKKPLNPDASLSINLEDKIVNDLLFKLSKWEEDKGFLNQDVNQSILARELKTNSTYLSRVINTYKNQNFSNYLKDIRITYAINYLKDNPKFIKDKSTIQIAEQFGFNSIDVFTRAIKKKIGLTPSVFFKQINRSNL